MSSLLKFPNKLLMQIATCHLARYAAASLLVLTSRSLYRLLQNTLYRPPSKQGLVCVIDGDNIDVLRHFLNFGLDENVVLKRDYVTCEIPLVAYVACEVSPRRITMVRLLFRSGEVATAGSRFVLSCGTELCQHKPGGVRWHRCFINVECQWKLIFAGGNLGPGS
jgi:hypothetical protein